MLELFTDLPPDHDYFRQFSFISADDLPDYSTPSRVRAWLMPDLPAALRPDNDP